MKIEFLLPKDGVEGKLSAVDEFGKPVKVSKIVWEPLFYRRDAAPVVLYGSVFNKLGRLAHKMYLTVSGSRGKLMLTDCTRPVEPAYDCREAESNKVATVKVEPTKSKAGGNNFIAMDAAMSNAIGSHGKEEV